MVRQVDLERISKKGWIQRWAGSYTFISCSYWGRQYYFSLKREFKIGFPQTLFIHKKGIVSFHLPLKDYRRFGQTLANSAVKNPAMAKKYCRLLKHNSDLMMPILAEKNKIPNWSEYEKFEIYFDRHLIYHNFVKKSIDFLPLFALKKYLHDYEDARVYSEKVFSETELFFRSIMKLIGKKEQFNSDYLTCLDQYEFESYLKNKNLPAEAVLKKRFSRSALFFQSGKLQIITGSQVDQIDRLISKLDYKAKILQGVSAYPGLVRGRARIVPDPFKVKIFNKGEILITAMTRPEFMPVMLKASAIVTESGGILSHAAITARELKKPCIVGTNVATKMIQDGDLVEVDATRGVVRKI